MIEQECSIPEARVAFIGRLSSVDRPVPSRPTLEELYSQPYEGRTIRDLARHYRPSVSLNVELPELVAGFVEWKTIRLTVGYLGALLDPNAHVDNEVDELLASFTARAIAAGTTDDEGRYRLVELALGVRAIDEMMDPNWILAENQDLEDADVRLRIREKLASGNDADILPSELVLVPRGPAVPFDLALVEGTSTALGEEELADLYRETKAALLSVTPPASGGYAEFLGDLRLRFRDALASAIEAFRATDDELARNWMALAMILTASPDAPSVQTLDVPGSWLIPESGEFTRIRGYASPNNSSAQREAFRSLVVGPDETDQHRAALRVLLMDPVEDPRALKILGEWSKENDLILFANAAASNLDELARTADRMRNGTHEECWKHVAFCGDSLNLSRGEGGLTVSIPTAAALVALGTMLALRKPAADAPATGMALPAAGAKHPFLQFTGSAKSLERLASESQPRNIDALRNDANIERATGGWITVPAPRPGGDSLAPYGGKTAHVPLRPDAPERVFEHIASVWVRNWVVRSIKYMLRNEYRGSSIDDSSLTKLQAQLATWLASLDERKGKRLIHGTRSSIKVGIRDGDRLHIDVELCYRTIISAVSVADHISTEELIFEFDEEQGVYAPATAP